MVVLPPPDTRLTTLLSWKRTRDEVGVPPVLFVYFTVKVKVVVGVPLVVEVLPSVRDTVPHVAESPSTGPANRSRDALNRTVDATAPTKTDRMRRWYRLKLDISPM